MTEMKGTNLIDTFKKAANEIVMNLRTHDSVIGALYTGGIVREFADKYSDVDVIIFLQHEDPSVRVQAHSLSKETESKYNVETDIEIHVLYTYMKMNWNEYLKWDLSNSVIVFDKDGTVTELLAKKLKVPEEEWLFRIALEMTYVSWYCFPLESNIPSMIDLWEDRGDPISAQYAVTYTLDMIVETLYNINRSFLPAPKWRMQYTQTLNWIPDNFIEAVRDAMLIREISIEDTRRRAEILAPIWKQMLGRIYDEFGMDYEMAGNIYVKKVLNLPVD